jgi:chorismate mutase / prephenate dehydratase
MTRRRKGLRTRAEMDSAAADPLQAIRRRIDAVDEEMHRLLIERSGVIAELIEIKGTSRPGAAFRPDREADLMRRLALRHEGVLPLVTVEHIWREIVTAFTAIQAPFGVAAGPCRDPLLMRDLVRFYFGFSVPVSTFATAAAAIEHVAMTGCDVAVVALDGGERWWGLMADKLSPKVFAKLPFIEASSRPAAEPAYVIGPPLTPGAAPDMQVYAVSDDPKLDRAVHALGGSVAVRSDAEAVIELPIAATLGDLSREAGQAIQHRHPLGGFAQPIRFLSERRA